MDICACDLIAFVYKTGKAAAKIVDRIAGTIRIIDNGGIGFIIESRTVVRRPVRIARILALERTDTRQPTGLAIEEEAAGRIARVPHAGQQMGVVIVLQRNFVAVCEFY